MKNAEQPAFPTQELNQQRSNAEMGIVVYDSIGGLTKREYFAGLAMQGQMASMDNDQNITKRTMELMATESVKLADALLAELAKQP